METSEPSLPESGAIESTSSPADSPAKTSAAPAKARASKAPAQACGSKCSAWSATFDPATSSWRTVPCSEHAGSTSSSLGFPSSGLMQRGRLSARKTSAPATDETGCGFLLPTPTACSYGSNQGGAAGRVGPVRHSLQSMAKHNAWPTPTANDSKNKLYTICGKTGREQPTLLAMARWPTPTARLGDARRGMPSPEQAQKRFDSGRRNLDDAVRIWPSPAARDYRSGRGRQENGHTPQLCEAVGGTLNPSWVEWLMGLPIGWTGSVHLGMPRSPSKPPPPSDDSWPL